MPSHSVKVTRTTSGTHTQLRMQCWRPSTRCVPVKTDDQLDLQALHRVRSRLVGQRTAVINQIRSFLLERGIAVRQRPHFLRQQLPEILATRIDVLSARMIGIIEDLGRDWRRLDERLIFTVRGKTGERDMRISEGACLADANPTVCGGVGVPERVGDASAIRP